MQFRTGPRARLTRHGVAECPALACPPDVPWTDEMKRGPDTAALAHPSAVVPWLWWGRVFPGEERQLGMLRRWLAELLPDCPSRDDVASGATELGSNAI